jgi:hypothetical protein
MTLLRNRTDGQWWEGIRLCSLSDERGTVWGEVTATTVKSAASWYEVDKYGRQVPR